VDFSIELDAIWSGQVDARFVWFTVHGIAKRDGLHRLAFAVKRLSETSAFMRTNGRVRPSRSGAPSSYAHQRQLTQLHQFPGGC
jgi:hypothetical protein